MKFYIYAHKCKITGFQSFCSLSQKMHETEFADQFHLLKTVEVNGIDPDNFDWSVFDKPISDNRKADLSIQIAELQSELDGMDVDKETSH